ncbi:uncharacterized protein LOC119277629 [Triticum dicoccoides]|uniref:uncharacterized protein LOC119277629 n=1 Tax=Triticum dicoccoides TaxID=85692 RepID=UPI00188F297C|nr:uncharacterized protein LOC119277629 [Triticum dicoccoides]
MPPSGPVSFSPPRTVTTPRGAHARSLPRTLATARVCPARSPLRTIGTASSSPRTVAEPRGCPARALSQTAMPPGDTARVPPRTVAMPLHGRAPAFDHHLPMLLPLGDDGDGTNKVWAGEKRRRKYLPPSSSATTQHLQDPISHATDMEMEDTILPQEGGDEHTGPGVILTKEDQAEYAKILRPNISPPIDPNSYMAFEDYDEIEERLARLRIAYYKIVKPEAAHELKEPEEYTEDELIKESYFRHLEDDDSFEWFFHRDDSQNPGLNDYQRIVLSNFLPDSCERLYRYHDDYRSRYHTYEIDSVYVKYYGEISKKLKWVADYVNLDRSTEKWRNMDTIAWRQALRIATHFPHMTVRLAAFAYNEYIIELREDASLKDIDLLYFEIWRLVAKEDRKYLDAVKEVYAMDKFAIHKRVLHAELNAATVFVTIKQMIYSIVKEGGIDLKAKEDEARDVFSKLAFGKHKTKNMAQYAEKKMEIAGRLGLDKKERFVFARI